MYKKILYVGIDPQPFVIAVYAENQSQQHLMWVNHYLKKKVTFDNVQGWQEYIIRECNNIIYNLKEKYPEYILDVAVEQQRGRIKSIIEQSLLASCVNMGIKCTLISPRSWKKIIDFKSEPGNDNNKKTAFELNKKFIQTYYPQYMKLKRVHDLCDARLISKALIKKRNPL